MAILGFVYTSIDFFVRVCVKHNAIFEASVRKILKAEIELHKINYAPIEADQIEANFNRLLLLVADKHAYEIFNERILDLNFIRSYLV